MKSFNAIIKASRIQDQFFQIGSIAVACLLVGSWNNWIWVWMLSTVTISSGAFILNEIVDSKDTDQLSWNTVHITSVAGKEKILIISAAFYIFLGLMLSFTIDKFYWALSMTGIAILYSIKPVRFKAMFGMDIISQIVAGWLIPFWAVLWNQVSLEQLFWFSLVMAGYNWFLCFPYQISDYEADLHTGIKSTHVVLGIEKSILIGAIFGFVALGGFFVSGMYRMYWTYSGFILFIWTALEYVRWFRLKDEEVIISSMQSFIKKVMPVSRVYVGFLVLLMIYLTS